MANEAVQDELRRIAGRIRVTKITATRTIKGSTGETFAGFSGGLESINEKSGLMLDTVESEQVVEAGFTLKDAKLAHLVLAMTTDIQAIDTAWASGSITADYRRDLRGATKQRYALLIRENVLGSQSNTEDNT